MWFSGHGNSIHNIIPLLIKQNVHKSFYLDSVKWFQIGGACGVMVIVVGNGHGDTSSNPGRDWFRFIARIAKR